MIADRGDSEDHIDLGARLFVGLQHALPQHLLSRAIYHITRARTPALKNLLIRSFVRHFRPEMQEAAQSDPLRYESFNQFFTRALRPDARPVDPDPRTVVSPVDGAVSQIGYLDGLRILQAKNRSYGLDELLTEPAGDTRWVERFTGGAFATLYLAPFNYHRIHMPLSGELRSAWHVPGALFSVNAATARCVSGLFARNERVVCVFEQGPAAFALVLVGALFVGSMSTVWHGEVTPLRGGKAEAPWAQAPAARGTRRERSRSLSIGATQSPLALPKGAEMGRFNMGSTVILLFPSDWAAWLPERRSGTAVSVGQPLAALRK